MPHLILFGQISTFLFGVIVPDQLPAQSFEIKLSNVLADDSCSLMLAAAIRIGRPVNQGVEPIKYVGAGKVLRVV